MRARKLGLRVGTVSLAACALLASSIAGGLAACGSSDSAVHGFVYDGSASSHAGGSGDSTTAPGNEDAGDDGDGDGTPDATVTDAGHGDASTTKDSGGGSDAAPVADAGPDVDAAPPSGLTCDGTVYPGEYGDATHTYATGTPAQDWYMTWDATNLYVAIDNADTTQAAVMYIDLGTGGATVGTAFDGTDLATLPVAADIVLYFKASYAGFFAVNGTAWPMGPLTTNAAYRICQTAKTREIVVPWSVIATAFGGTLPATFNYLGYVIGSNSYIYGQIPSSNPVGVLPADAGFPHYFDVTSTADGGTTPFANPM